MFSLRASSWSAVEETTSSLPSAHALLRRAFGLQGNLEAAIAVGIGEGFEVETHIAPAER
jgi:hypothetical protein